MSNIVAIPDCGKGIGAPSLEASDTHLLGLGVVGSLEEKIAVLCGRRHALSVCNATFGLTAIALALNLRDAEFVVPAYTYGASLAGWLMLGNRPRFADIDPMTLTLDPVAARRAITRKTRAILSVDIYGNPADSAGLRRLADEHGLWYVADAAQSFGATREGKPASYGAHASVLSFTVGKTLCAGEGGAILTDNTELYHRLVWQTQHPARQRRELGLRLTNEFALNGRIHPSAAALADQKFESALRGLSLHQDRCFKLIARLNEMGLTSPISFERGLRPAFFRLTAECAGRTTPGRLTAALQARGVHAVVRAATVRPVDHQAAFRAQYRSLKSPVCPITRRADRERVEVSSRD